MANGPRERADDDLPKRVDGLGIGSTLEIAAPRSFLESPRVERHVTRRSVAIRALHVAMQKPDEQVAFTGARTFALYRGKDLHEVGGTRALGAGETFKIGRHATS